MCRSIVCSKCLTDKIEQAASPVCDKRHLDDFESAGNECPALALILNAALTF